MPSERIQRRIDALLDEADVAVTSGDWLAVAEKARAALSLDSENADGRTFLSAAQQHLGPTDAPTGPSSPSAVGEGRVRVRAEVTRQISTGHAPSAEALPAAGGVRFETKAIS